MFYQYEFEFLDHNTVGCFNHLKTTRLHVKNEIQFNLFQIDMLPQFKMTILQKKEKISQRHKDIFWQIRKELCMKWNINKGLYISKIWPNEINDKTSYTGNHTKFYNITNHHILTIHVLCRKSKCPLIQVLGFYCFPAKIIFVCRLVYLDWLVLYHLTCFVSLFFLLSKGIY